MTILKLIGPALIAGLLSSAPAAAQSQGQATAASTPNQTISLGRWARFTPEGREAAVIAAIEGVLLAAMGPNGDQVRFDSSCLASDTPQTVERKLLELAPRSPNVGFVDALLEVTSCRPVRQ